MITTRLAAAIIRTTSIAADVPIAIATLVPFSLEVSVDRGCDVEFIVDAVLIMDEVLIQSGSGTKSPESFTFVQAG